MIDVHLNATLSESFGGDRSRVIVNRCKNFNVGQITKAIDVAGKSTLK